MAMPAVLAVINTTELLEQILLNLSMTELILARRVAPIYKATIDESHALQQLLFLRAGPITRCITYRADYVTRQPYLVKPRPARDHTLNPNLQFPVVQVHPAIWNSIPSEDVTHARSWIGFDLDAGSVLDWGQGQREQMFVTQPPAKELIMEIRNARHGDRNDVKVIRDHAGVRLGHIRAVVEKHGLHQTSRTGPCPCSDCDSKEAFDVSPLEATGAADNDDDQLMIPQQFCMLTVLIMHVVSADSGLVAQAERQTQNLESGIGLMSLALQ